MRDILKIWRKWLLKTRLVTNILCLLIAGYIRFVYYTSRKNIIIPDGMQPYFDGDKAAIFVFWHGKLLMMPMITASCKKDIYVMISNHADGEMIARTMASFGINTVRGSSSRNGRAVVSEALEVLRGGGNLSITPDGPRGPAKKVQPGVARIAARANMPVVPVSYSASRGECINSWDSFLIPYPFCRLVFTLGDPVNISKGELDTADQKIEESLNKADGFVNEYFFR